MPTIHFKASVLSCQVECPDVIDGRAFQRYGAHGAIHVRPNSTRHVTEDELNLLRGDSRVGPHISVLAADADAKPTPKPPAVGTASSLPASPPPAEAGASPDPPARSAARSPKQSRGAD